jgi:hypothetical protein
MAGLGRVRVWRDGQFEVEVETGESSDATSPRSSRETESLDLRAAALRHGWAEPLSWVRRGFDLASGIALIDGAGCSTQRVGEVLLLGGDIHDCAPVALALGARGWRLVAYRIVPLTFVEGAVTVTPNPSPVLLSARRARILGRETTRVRADSDARRVEGIEWSSSGGRIGGVALVRVRRPHDEVLTERHGYAAVERLAGVLVGGVLRPDASRSADVAMAQRTTLARCGVVDVAFADADANGSATALEAWWRSR